jgi:hypothetical protein
MSELSRQSTPERELRRAAAGEAGGWAVQQVLGFGFLYLGAKLDELVQLAYRHTGLDVVDESSRDGWSADE